MVTLAMAAFAVAVRDPSRRRHEHQHGLMLAIATESIVKLVAFITAGAFVTFWMFTPEELIERAMKTPEAVRAIDYVPSIGNFLITTLLSFGAIMMLPRQFHVSVVENSGDAEVGRARWLFPLYLVAINLFVIPIALAGLIAFPFGAADSDMYVLALPIEANAHLLSLGVFVGGLSAATAMGGSWNASRCRSWCRTTSSCRWCCSASRGRTRRPRISATSCSSRAASRSWSSC